jgi:hypothetical protein
VIVANEAGEPVSGAEVGEIMIKGPDDPRCRRPP